MPAVYFWVGWNDFLPPHVEYSLLRKRLVFPIRGEPIAGRLTTLTPRVPLRSTLGYGLVELIVNLYNRI